MTFIGSCDCTMEKAMPTHSSTLAWRFPWVEEPGRLQSMGSRRVRGVGHDWATSLSLFTFMHWRRKWQPIVLAWRIPGMAEPGGLPSVGSHRAGHDWSHLAAVAVTAQTADGSLARRQGMSRVSLHLWGSYFPTKGPWVPRSDRVLGWVDCCSLLVQYA